MRKNLRFYLLLFSGLLTLGYLWVFPILDSLDIVKYADGTPIVYMILLPFLTAAIWVVVSAANIIDKRLSRNISKRQIICIVVLEIIMSITPFIIAGCL